MYYLNLPEMFGHGFQLLYCNFALHPFAFLNQRLSCQGFLELPWEVHQTFLDFRRHKKHYIMHYIVDRYKKRPTLYTQLCHLININTRAKICIPLLNPRTCMCFWWRHLSVVWHQSLPYMKCSNWVLWSLSWDHYQVLSSECRLSLNSSPDTQIWRFINLPVSRLSFGV